LPEILAEHDASVAVVAFGHYSDRVLTDVVRSKRLGYLSLFLVPRLFELGSLPSSHDHIGAIPVLRPRIVRMSGLSWLGQRTFDIGARLTDILLLSLRLAAVALAVRREGGPGVIFRQVRVGRNGREFEVLKFR